MRLLKLDHGNVSKLERESAERDYRHSVLMNSSLLKKKNNGNAANAESTNDESREQPGERIKHVKQDLADVVERELQRQMNDTDKSIN